MKRAWAIVGLFLLIAVGAPEFVRADDPEVPPVQGDAEEVERARELFSEAVALEDEGRNEEALTRLEQAVEIFDRKLGEDRETANAVSLLGYVLNALRRQREALPFNQRALAMYRLFHAGDHAQVVAGLNNLASSLRRLGRHREALPLQEEALAMRLRLSDGKDSPDVAYSLWYLALTVERLGRHADALALHERALAMYRRLSDDESLEIAEALNSIGCALVALDRAEKALEVLEKAAAMYRRLLPPGHTKVATGVANVAAALGALGRFTEALPFHVEALAMQRTAHPDGHPRVTLALNGLAGALTNLGRHEEALPLVEEALAIWRAIAPGDHPDVAVTLHNVGGALGKLGRHAEAVPYFQAARAMLARLVRGDHPFLAQMTSNLAATLQDVGRPADALPLEEEALAMRRRLYPGGHRDVANSLNNLGSALYALGRAAEALPLNEQALEMRRRVFEGDHPLVANSLNNLALDLEALGRADDALPLKRDALAMRRRIFPGDHEDVAQSIHNLAHSLDGLGRLEEALALREEALAMYRRVYGGDHPEIARSINNLGGTLYNLGRQDEAIAHYRSAAEMAQRSGWAERHIPLTFLGNALVHRHRYVEAVAPLKGAMDGLARLRRHASSLRTSERADYLAHIRGGIDPFPSMIEAQIALGSASKALLYLERGRAREMLDLLERGRIDLPGEARRRAAGDEAATARLDAVDRAIRRAQIDRVRCERAEDRARKIGRLTEIHEARRAAATARKAVLEALGRQHRQLVELLPETDARTPAEIQALLEEDERMLVYSLGDRASFVFLVSRTDLRAVQLRDGERPLLVARMIARVRALQQTLADADEPVSTDASLFRALVPTEVWPDVKAAKRVYVVGHGVLHELPFEALVVREDEGKPVFWLDEGPPIAYVPSGSVLAWLRTRRDEQRAKAGPLSLVAVGDPVFARTAGPLAWPEQGVLITEVEAEGQAAGLGLRPGDVIVAYGGHEITETAELRAAFEAEAEATSVSVRVCRGAEELTVSAKPGRLGIQITVEPPRVAGPKLLADRPLPTAWRHAEGRGPQLGPLPGTRDEVEAIGNVFLERKPADARVTLLLGRKATESRLFAAVDRPRFLHVATHGVTDETETASFSFLALTSPLVPVPGDDGELTLSDVLTTWRGRLEGTELVVLSACETHRGRLQRDEGIFALPWGFHFAGCPTVVATHWRVADVTTPALMEAFYRRLVEANGAEKLAALVAAKRALRRTHPHPAYWAPFVLLGDPR